MDIDIFPTPATNKAAALARSVAMAADTAGIVAIADSFLGTNNRETGVLGDGSLDHDIRHVAGLSEADWQVLVSSDGPPTANDTRNEIYWFRDDGNLRLVVASVRYKNDLIAGRLSYERVIAISPTPTVETVN